MIIVMINLEGKKEKKPVSALPFDAVESKTTLGWVEG